MWHAWDVGEVAGWPECEAPPRSLVSHNAAWAAPNRPRGRGPATPDPLRVLAGGRATAS